MHNLQIRKLLEAVYVSYSGDRNNPEFQGLEVYLKRVWFSSGIYHHYACDKFVPAFSPEFLRECIEQVDVASLPLKDGESVQAMCDKLFPVMFDPKCDAQAGKSGRWGRFGHDFCCQLL